MGAVDLFHVDFDTEAGTVGDFCGKRGVVLALGGEPVNGGAEGFGVSD